MQAVTRPTDALIDGRRASQEKRWRDARDLLAKAEAAAPLGPPDYELLATADFLVSPDPAGLDVWERAHHIFLERGDVPRAVRAAFWLALTLLNRDEEARSGGWLARGQRLLDDSGTDCVERGYLLLATAVRAMRAGDFARGRALMEEVVAVARHFSDEDLATVGRMGQGRALLAVGEIAAGQAAIDEVMVAITSAAVSPLVVGIVYCSVITGLRLVYDMGRAREWTASLERWCESQPDLQMYRGECLIYKGEVSQNIGAWDAAMHDMIDARTRLLGPPPHPSAASAVYHEAELHRLAGRFAEAEEAYVRSSELGRSPQPGLALLRMAQGRLRVAEASVRRSLAETQAMPERAALLPGCVEVLLAAGDVDGAEAAAEELGAIATATSSDYLAASAGMARGALLLARGNPAAALQALRAAAESWQRLDAAHQLARTRLLVGRACAALGDQEGAQLELESARTSFIRLGANHDLAMLDGIATPRHGAENPLSKREFEVAELVSAGLSNKAIAARLFLSERTVETHVKHTCDKLGFNSRTQVAAWITALKVGM